MGTSLGLRHPDIIPPRLLLLLNIETTLRRGGGEMGGSTVRSFAPLDQGLVRAYSFKVPIMGTVAHPCRRLGRYAAEECALRGFHRGEDRVWDPRLPAEPSKQAGRGFAHRGPWTGHSPPWSMRCKSHARFTAPLLFYYLTSPVINQGPGADDPRLGGRGVGRIPAARCTLPQIADQTRL